MGIGRCVGEAVSLIRTADVVGACCQRVAVAAVAVQGQCAVGAIAIACQGVVVVGRAATAGEVARRRLTRAARVAARTQRRFVHNGVRGRRDFTVGILHFGAHRHVSHVDCQRGRFQITVSVLHGVNKGVGRVDRDGVGSRHVAIAAVGVKGQRAVVAHNRSAHVEVLGISDRTALDHADHRATVPAVSPRRVIVQHARSLKHRQCRAFGHVAAVGHGHRHVIDYKD